MKKAISFNQIHYHNLSDLSNRCGFTSEVQRSIVTLLKPHLFQLVLDLKPRSPLRPQFRNHLTGSFDSQWHPSAQLQIYLSRVDVIGIEVSVLVCV